MRFDIKDKVKLQPFLTLSDAITYAESVKEINELSSRKNTRRGLWNVNIGNKATAAHSSLTQSTKEQEKDKTSDLNGKKIEEIPKKQTENMYQRPNLSKCFYASVVDKLAIFLTLDLKERP